MRNDRRKERGQTLLEFALVAPLLIFFVLALVDFGIAIDRRLVLDHAVREGARFASVGEDLAAIQQYTGDQSQGIVAPEEVLVDCTTEGSQEVVEVSVNHTHDFVTGFASFLTIELGSIDLSAAASARLEQPLGAGVCT